MDHLLRIFFAFWQPTAKKRRLWPSKQVASRFSFYIIYDFTHDMIVKSMALSGQFFPKRGSPICRVGAPQVCCQDDIDASTDTFTRGTSSLSTRSLGQDSSEALGLGSRAKCLHRSEQTWERECRHFSFVGGQVRIAVMTIMIRILLLLVVVVVVVPLVVIVMVVVVVVVCLVVWFCLALSCFVLSFLVLFCRVLPWFLFACLLACLLVVVVVDRIYDYESLRPCLWWCLRLCRKRGLQSYWKNDYRGARWTSCKNHEFATAKSDHFCFAVSYESLKTFSLFSEAPGTSFISFIRIIGWQNVPNSSLSQHLWHR